jgi:pimeloyl-ACP methyl ester carboxylesterase
MSIDLERPDARRCALASPAGRAGAAHQRLSHGLRGAGRGLPVILVHGTNGDYRSWVPQMEPLGARYRAISVSLRHYYPEPWDGEGEFSARQHVEDVIAFIEGLDAGRAFLIGHSRGGNMAMHAGQRPPWPAASPPSDIVLDL